MQGKAAGAPTGAEVQGFISDLIKLLQLRRAEAGLQPREDWAFVYDNASVHAELGCVCAGKVVVVHIPPHSPDFNKPIEHVWGQIDAHVHAWVRQRQQQQPGARITAAQLQAQVAAAFQGVSKDSVAADVASLPDTYEAVIAARGAYPPARFM
jgi:hypothetical protein